LPALQLLIDLYHAQSLAYVGGVHWRQLRELYERHLVGEHGQYVVWGFRRTGTPEVFNNTAPFVAGKPVNEEICEQLLFWDALKVLTTTGLAEFVGHVIDADTDEASVIHPYVLADTGEPGEPEIATAAHAAARSMLTAGQNDWADSNDLYLLPAERHKINVQLVGLLRLRYRAKTTATALWYAPDLWTQNVKRYDQLAVSLSAAAISR